MIYQHDRTECKWNPGQVNTLSYPEPDNHERFYEWPRDYYVDMKEYLSDRGLNHVLACNNGWFPIAKDGLRIYIPATTQIEGHVYWQARGIEGQELRYDSPNGPRRDALVVLKGKVQPQPIVCVVEGPMDALAMAELTGVTGIALLGLSPPQEAKDHLVKLCSSYEKVLLLPDKADIDGMMQIQDYMSIRGVKSTLKIPFDKKDVAEYTLQERRGLISE